MASISVASIPTFIQKLCLLNLFEDNGYQFGVDGVCASGNTPTQEVPTKGKSALKDLCSTYKDHLTRICKDIESLLRRRRNVTLTEEKLRVLELAFTKFVQAHITYIDTSYKNDVDCKK